MTRSAELKRIERITAESERTKDDPMPAGVRPAKPNKSTPVAVRLSHEEIAAVNAMAERLSVPLSSLLRGWILDGLNTDNAPATRPAVFSALNRLESDIKELQKIFRDNAFRDVNQAFEQAHKSSAA